jgi:AcrR family transcriptional regulator
MARPRTFDEDVMLSAVMHVFRHHGFVGTTVSALEAATGLTSGSLYNTYRDKQGLFDAASAHYTRAVLLRRLRDHAPAGSGLSGLRALFLSLLHEPGGETHGCLITNSAIEFGDASRPKFVSDGFAILRDAFADRLAEARQVAKQGAEALALLALYQGVLVLVRGGFDRSALETMVMQFFDDMEKQNGT